MRRPYEVVLVRRGAYTELSSIAAFPESLDFLIRNKLSASRLIKTLLDG